MSILCWIFGHQNVNPFSHVYGEYATEVRGPKIDDKGRQVFSLIVACPRCGDRYLACRIHGHWISDRIVNEKAETPKSGDTSDQDWINAGCPREKP